MLNHELETLLPMLRRFAYSLTGSMSDADDLLQSTIERILQKSVPEGADVTKWAFRVCRNIWIDDYRAQKVRREAHKQPELSAEQVVDGEREVTNVIALAQVNEAMNQLPDDQRSILSLVALQGMSYKDVAAMLDIPKGTVMSRLARARVALADMLKLNGSEVGA